VLASVCIAAAAAFGVVGIALGLYMGSVGDFALAHVHAHINLLGWVTLALYGLYHRGVPRGRSLAARAQMLLALVGTPVFIAGLTIYFLSGREK
jgi:hypothetical protein